MRARHILHAGATALALTAALVIAGGADAAAVTPSWEVSLSGDSPVGSVKSVSSVSGDLAWAAGRKGQGGVIMRWDGTRWSTDPAPGLPSVWFWWSISAVSADDVWAYGSSDASQTLVHYDGERWTTVPTTGPYDGSFPDTPIKAVPGRLFKGGEALYTYADGTWQTYALPDLVHIRDIDALSADDAYAVGMQYPVDGGHPVVYHWDGTTWTLMDQPPVPPGTETAKVAVESANSVYVAGWATGADGGPSVPSVVHWDGTAWTDITGSLSALDLDAISTDGSGGLWVTGYDETDPSSGGPILWHYDGTTWTKESAATASDGATQWLDYTFNDLAPADDSGGFWVVGDYATTPDANGDRSINGLIERSDPPTDR